MITLPQVQPRHDDPAAAPHAAYQPAPRPGPAAQVERPLDRQHHRRHGRSRSRWAYSPTASRRRTAPRWWTPRARPAAEPSSAQYQRRDRRKREQGERDRRGLRQALAGQAAQRQRPGEQGRDGDGLPDPVRDLQRHAQPPQQAAGVNSGCAKTWALGRSSNRLDASPGPGIPHPGQVLELVTAQRTVGAGRRIAVGDQPNDREDHRDNRPQRQRPAAPRPGCRHDVPPARLHPSPP